MLRALALSMGVALLALSVARAADEPKDILARAIKAHGGEELLTKFKAARAKSTGKIDLPGLGEVTFTQEIATMHPDKLRDAMELTVGGQKVSTLTLVNGDKVTIEANGKAIDLPDGVKWALKDVGHMAKVSRLVGLTGKEFELSIVGEDKVEGREVVGIRVSAKGQKDINLYFDKATHLLTKLEYRVAEPTTGKEVNEERVITEYTKNKDGLAVPKKVLVKHDGKTFVEAEVVEYTALEQIDESEFRK